MLCIRSGYTAIIVSWSFVLKQSNKNTLLYEIPGQVTQDRERSFCFRMTWQLCQYNILFFLYFFNLLIFLNLNRNKYFLTVLAFPSLELYVPANAT